MKKTFRKLCLLAALGAGLAANLAQASVVIEGTRVVFPGQEREVTLKLKNTGKQPALVQAWFDKGDPTVAPEKLDVPFTLTPAVFRLDPDKGQTLRIIYSKEPLAQDRESLFWLNVLEVPPKSDDTNQLQLAFRSRIKLMFRPQGLPGSAEEAPAQVRWEVVPAEGGKGYALRASNPTAFHVNLGELELVVGGKRFDAGAGHVPPRGAQLFPIGGLNERPAGDARVDYGAINDFGGPVKGQRPLGAVPVR
ncbi:chaperone protein EcpD [Variovorax boronicumulans]|uniref:Chaperone protein EcpD n=1 Tax=Variovorax boronicumulans TaxID=436515 RepID=A0AAW8DQK1_9BURK|nr:fimbria/pilus periplasmic chaperone [Variovorax boronicumulans]MDP9876457.1 chaperone protein EcpD [Variovorax boronicumulans]MDP9921741.1 chaperone protein EcpD [Variovorax boronicumulans]